MKKVLVYVVAAAMVFTVFGFNPAEASAVSYGKIGKVGSSTKTMKVGQEIELDVNKGRGVSDNDLWWSIANTNILAFDDEDRSDDEIEVRALKAGTTKVYCKNELTGGKITYTVKVSKATGKLSRVGAKTRTVNKGAEFELAVRLNGSLTSNDVLWTIEDTSVVNYDDDDRYDNDMEFNAVNGGTTKITAENLNTGGKIYYTVKVKAPKAGVLGKVGNSTKTIEVDDDITLKVSKGEGLSEEDIVWSIAKSSVLRFEDGDNIGSSVEVEGLKKGTTKVYAKNLQTGGRIIYTIKVVPDYD